MKSFKKTIAVLLAFLTVSMTSVAQSCDAAYPFWGWVNELPETGNAPYWVEIDVNRVTKPDRDFGGRKGCGYISVTDSNDGKELYKGQLNYAGKDLNADGTSTGIYYFDVRTKDGRTAKLGIKRTTGGVVTTLVSGQVPGSSAFHNKTLTHLPFNGTWIPVGVESTTEKDLLDDLRDALTDYDKDRTEYRTKGFGNVKQYIAAHANLDPAKPKYAKPKGAGAVNIRATASTTAQKVADLQPGQTLLVTDEYDGWCQVKLGDKKFGWVSLSVVTLTNTPGQATAATASGNTTTAEADCPLTGDWNGYLGNAGWGECSLFLQTKKKVGITTGIPKQAGNGSISMTDEEWVQERKYNLLFIRSIDSNTFEFTVQLMVGKQLKQGKMQIKRNGKQIIMTGLDAWAKQQPFHGKTMEKNQQM